MAFQVCLVRHRTDCGAQREGVLEDFYDRGWSCGTPTGHAVIVAGVIGFDGPPSLASTMDGSYTTRKYMVEGAEWPYDQHPEVLRYRRP